MNLSFLVMLFIVYLPFYTLLPLGKGASYSKKILDIEYFQIEYKTIYNYLEYLLIVDYIVKYIY